MKARDVMVSPVVTVKPSTTIREVAKLFLERQISAVPVVDQQGKLVGIVSEGDLMHRAEIGTEQRRSWWPLLLAEDSSGHQQPRPWRAPAAAGRQSCAQE
jgi:CBS-domain-containing membrane protein